MNEYTFDLNATNLQSKLDAAKQRIEELESKLDTAIKLITQARAGLNHVGVVSNIDVWTAEADIFLEAQK